MGIPKLNSLLMLASLSTRFRLVLPLVLLGLVAVMAVDRAKTPIEMEVDETGAVTLKVSGFPGKHYRFEMSEDLVNWEGVALVQGLGPLRHTVPAIEDGKRRFFRAEERDGGAGMPGEIVATTAEGDITLRPVEHASFALHWNGITLYNDPVGSANDYRRFPDPDIILVGHQHGDHFNASVLSGVAEDQTVIICPQAVFQQLSSSLKERATVLANGESTEVKGVVVEAVPAYNDRHPEGRDNGYVVNLGGKRFYMSGDTEDVDEMRALEAIDVAFVAMNLPFTMSVDQAASALLEFKPKKVFPYHYRNSDGSFADLDRLQGKLSEDSGIELRRAEWY